MSKLTRHLGADEKVLWSGKPARIPFILSKILYKDNPMNLFIGLVCLAFSAYWMIAGAPAQAIAAVFFVGIVMILVPSIWRILSYSNTGYLITDKRVIVQTGSNTRFTDLKRIREVYVQISFVDKQCGTGTVHVDTTSGIDTSSLAFLEEPHAAQKLLQSAVAGTVAYCSKCGAANPADSKLCPHCGKMVAE